MGINELGNQHNRLLVNPAQEEGGGVQESSPSLEAQGCYGGAGALGHSLSRASWGRFRAPISYNRRQPKVTVHVGGMNRGMVSRTREVTVPILSALVRPT